MAGNRRRFVTSSGIANLKDCSSLRRLYVHDVNLSGDALPWLSGLKKLEALSLQRTGIDGAILKNLKSPDLVVLNLSGDKYRMRTSIKSRP